MKFTRFRRITAGTIAVIAATLLLQTSITRAAGHGPLRINFEKCFAPDGGPFGGHYEGTVNGDLGVGTVLFTFRSAFPGEKIWHFSGEYEITTPDATITVLAAGIDALRSRGGHDVLNGVVIEGDYLGAQAQVRAQDTQGGACAVGIITIMPSK